LDGGVCAGRWLYQRAVELIYPRFYFYGRFGSDRDWIFSRMAVIPQDKQQSVADKYEQLYKTKTPDHRKNANTYLQEMAKQCQPSN